MAQCCTRISPVGVVVNTGITGSIRKIVKQPITGYHQDDEQHWVAELACGHFQHVRHNPPWTQRPWVITGAGRATMLGHQLNCKKCDTGAPLDHPDR
ncbi:MAG: DUF3565 domain-containing protein [Granulosicoccaceae bacterium]|jgi:hypothetical protein